MSRRVAVVGVALSRTPAFGEAGVTPGDIDVCCIYDAFTFMVLETLEDLGFCAKGEGGSFVSDGRLRLGGELPTNRHDDPGLGLTERLAPPTNRVDYARIRAPSGS